MSALDALLNADLKKVTERPTEKFEVKRLSKVLGEKFELTLRGIPGQLLAEISENNTEYGRHGKIEKTNGYVSGLDIVINGTVDPNFKDKNLMKKFGVVTPRDAVEKLLLPGEIGEIAKEITKLCGVSTQTEIDDEVKN